MLMSYFGSLKIEAISLQKMGLTSSTCFTLTVNGKLIHNTVALSLHDVIKDVLFIKVSLCALFPMLICTLQMPAFKDMIFRQRMCGL